MNLAKRMPDSTILVVSAESQGKFNNGMRSFIEEARLLANIRHPNIVAVLDFAKANGTAYLVMRYEHGHSLEAYLGDLLERGKTIPESFLRRSLFICSRVCEKYIVGSSCTST